MPLNARPNGVFTQTLTKRIIAGIEGQFSLSEHQPAPAHWKGLRAIAETVVAMVFGQAKDKFYLSSLPTGDGQDDRSGGDSEGIGRRAFLYGCRFPHSR
jgi:hypothetical protein